MNTTTLIILIAIGLLTGSLSGMLGIGGGIIMIPAMVYFLGFTQHQAVGTSLAVMLPPIGAFAAYNYYKAGHVDVKVALILAATFILGSYLTSKLAVKMPEQIIKKIFAGLLLFIAIKMFFSK
jgi:uncharacterized protein